MPYETKRYKQAHLFLNEFLSTHIDKLETDFDLESTKHELKYYPADGGFVWCIQKFSLWDYRLNKFVLEFRVDCHNLKYLQSKKMTKKEYSQRRVKKTCFVYIVDQNLRFIPPALLKNKHNKKEVMFIHDKYWFKDFITTKRCPGYIYF